MTDPTIQDMPDVRKNTSEWTTGGEPATGPQRSYISTLAHEAGEDVDSSRMTKAEASLEIQRLRRITGKDRRSNSRHAMA